MYGLTTTKGLNRRGGLAAFAIAMLLSLAATPAPAQAQLHHSFFAFEGFHGGVSVGAAAGQTVRILIEAADASSASLIKPSEEPGVIVGAGPGAPGGHVKVFNGSTGALLWSRELPSLAAGLHTIDISRDELPEAGEPVTGRLQLWIELVIAPRRAGSGRAAVPQVKVFRPTFEVIDNVNGRTTVHGALLNVAGQNTFAN